MIYGISVVLAAAIGVAILLSRRIAVLEKKLEEERERRWQWGEELRAAKDEVARLTYSLPSTPVSDPVAVLGSAMTQITEAIGKTISGAFGQPPSQQVSVDMGQLGYDGEAGIKPGEWFPDIEFDRMMGGDPSSWPTRGGWVNTTPIPQDMRRDIPNPEGGVETSMGDVYSPYAKDGSQRFAAGDGIAMPPSGGVE